MRYVV